MNMSEEEKVAFRLQIVARGIQLHEENERLKKRLSKRLRMARHWKKSFMDLYKATTTTSAKQVKAKMLMVEASVG